MNVRRENTDVRWIVGVGVVVVAAVEFKLLLRVDEDRVAQDQQPQLEPGVRLIQLFPLRRP